MSEQGSKTQPTIQPIDTSIVDVDEFKAVYLFGVPIKDAEGCEPENIFFEQHLKRAIAWVETQLQIKVSPTVFTGERHDYYVNEYAHFAYVQLHHWPVVCVNRLEARYPSETLLLEFPLEWIKLEPLHGQIQLVPEAGSLSHIILGQGSSYLPLVTYRISSYLPALWHVDYTAGFEKGKVPEDILGLIYKKAAIDVLYTAGELIGGPGVTSTSLGLDALSESKSYSKGSGNIYSHRIQNYQEELTNDLSVLKDYWKGIRFQTS
jgi:hypothetical protein